MKTLQQIQATGCMATYMNGLGEATRLILPSKDGSEDKRCNFVLVLTDDDGLTNFVTDLPNEEAAKLMEDTVKYIRTNPEDLT